jgi:hypothetical protein
MSSISISNTLVKAVLVDEILLAAGCEPEYASVSVSFVDGAMTLIV